jgi:hypothetical protein
MEQEELTGTGCYSTVRQTGTSGVNGVVVQELVQFLVFLTNPAAVIVCI